MFGELNQELIVLVLLCFIILLLIWLHTKGEQRENRIVATLRNQGSQELWEMEYMTTANNVLSQKVALLESKVGYLMRIQQAKEERTEPKAKLLRKMDSKG